MRDIRPDIAYSRLLLYDVFTFSATDAVICIEIISSGDFVAE